MDDVAGDTMEESPGTVLFQTLKLGRLTLSHRIVMAPLTRNRAYENGVHSEIAIEYYTQRASAGGLLISEATFITEEAGGYRNVPGIWSSQQVSAWKRITDSVHSKGGYIFMQLWALGRAAQADVLASNGYQVVSASDIPGPGGTVPIPLSKDDITRYVHAYVEAAQNAVMGAGFDGVEIHDANGYLLDQFLQTGSNTRTDEFGGSVQNRSRFLFMIIKAVTEAIGEDRVGVRFSPFGTFGGMRMPDPIPTFSFVIREIRDKYPDFAYIHLIEAKDPQDWNKDSLNFARQIWNENGPRTFISAGGHDSSSAAALVKKEGGAVAFGKLYISNPDLPIRIKMQSPLNPYDHSTFYSPGPQASVGYTDYPFLVGR